MNTRIRIATVTPDGEASTPILVTAPVGTSFATLRPKLALAYEPCHAGRPLSGYEVLGSHPLLDGVLLEPARGGERPRTDHALRLVALSGPRQGGTLPLPTGHHVLGRGHALLGDDPLTSRRHARITLARGHVTIDDLASSNGLFRHGARLDPHVGHTWRVGESIRIGATVLRLDTSDDHGTDPAVVPDAPPPAPVPPQTFTWPDDPAPQRTAPLRWIAALAPVPIALLLAVFMHSPYLLGFILLGPLVMVLTHVDDRRRGKRGGRRAKHEHGEATRVVSRHIAQALTEELVALDALAPTPDALLAMSSGTRIGVGMRRGTTGLLIRMGHGDAPSCHTLAHGGDAVPLGLVEAPVVITLAPASITHLDTTNDDPEEIATLLELITAQLALLHDPGDAPPVVTTPCASTTRWAWAADSSRVRVSATTPDALLAALDDQDQGRDRTRVLPLVVVDARVSGAARVVRRLVTGGAVVVWVGHVPPPVVVTQQVRVGASIRVTCAPGHRRSQLPSGHAFTLDSPGASWFPSIMRRHHRWAAGAPGDRGNAALPSTHTEALLPSDLARAWQNPSMDVPIGHDHDGVLTLDLARTGPHALVAGTTGSGKSEFLLTYLRGLFTLNSPEHVNALLIDYKGGATFGPLARAPHVVGVITDLDHGLAARALTTLRAEISRRERLLTCHGLTSYRDLVDAAPHGVSLPRFFVVVDEFRVLAEELPEFVSGLVRLAAVGRSLGMHVILATQRPGGAVTADMRANLDVRVALRVRERSDSIDVIDTPDATRISARTPGRGYLATSGEAPLEFQSAYCGAPRDLDDGDARIHVHPTTMTPNGLVERRDQCDACRPGATSPRSDLALFVDEAIVAAGNLPPIHRPVHAPLPESIDELVAPGARTVDLAALTQERPILTERETRPAVTDAACARTAEPDAGASDHSDVIAIADLPAAQCQPLVTLARGTHVGISGAPRSGRTRAAHALATCARRDSDLWWVGPSDPAGADTHVRPDDVDAVITLLTHLGDDHPDASCVVIDGWEELHATLLRINHGLAVDDLLRRIGEGHRHGHTFIVTGGRQVFASKLATLLDLRLVMRQNDTSEYSLAGLRPAQVPAAMPPGRALVLPHGHPVHFRTPSAAVAARRM